MVQKPLITAVVIVAAILIGLSFAMVAFPDSVNDFVYVYGAVGLADAENLAADGLCGAIGILKVEFFPKSFVF